MLVSWKTVIYFSVAVAGVLIIGFLSSPMYSGNFFPFAISVFVLFVFLNIELSLIIFDTSFWKTCLTSIIAGLINAFMTITLIAVY